eukprot:CAMPEP_0113643660 /NCGR_PEP_ID=MMETSP0017_2-20120614/22966_1 /TAXON_ID=2856 /ORGANISM="Cylindrotheca closterium" /LENGTH=397 /DNA_ID=CAMNT_0000555205 /DNA_START=1 /DNA_END=1194 /DNA_ORIENTATION=- /assembly_acc=CAM_ASM_000147
MTPQRILLVSLACSILSSQPVNAFLSSPSQSRGQTSNSQHKLYAEKLFSQGVYDTIGEGRIAVIPNFLPQEDIIKLRNDATNLHQGSKFSTDALASYGSSGKFDPSKDRAVLKLQQWKDQGSGDWTIRERFGNRMKNLREDLAYNLDSVNKYGAGSTEISYTRFGPGAFLKRHVDEHHEELKGKAGWSKPTRRSMSWLIYLNDDWDANQHGGCLRCFERKTLPVSKTGARGSGDLQIGWLKATTAGGREEPVFMDAQHSGTDGANSGLCALYIEDPTSGAEGGRQYISKSFHSHPTLYIGGSELLVQNTLMNSKDLAQRFRLIEQPKSAVTDFLQSQESIEERILDVEPTGGTLVLFDSVTLPHAVLPTTTRERWATSGWMHEDQQPVETHPHFGMS